MKARLSQAEVDKSTHSDDIIARQSKNIEDLMAAAVKLKAKLKKQESEFQLIKQNLREEGKQQQAQFHQQLEE